ncbi:MAG: rubredoxin [Oscillospiraceae bacterium]|nr:rubredoxin [Oscillospiraceae bacterium]
MKYVCDVCGYVYDEAAEGTAWEELADDYACPLCSVGKDQFSKE